MNEEDEHKVTTINKEKITETDIYEAFNLFDKIGKNIIEIDDIPDVIHALGLKMDSDEVDQLIEDYANKDPLFDFEQISRDQFVYMIKSKLDVVQQVHPNKIFNMLDKDKDQKLNKNDIKFLMNILEETITDEQIEYMMLVADKDGDGFISYKEFLRVIMNEMVDDQSK